MTQIKYDCEFNKNNCLCCPHLRYDSIHFIIYCCANEADRLIQSDVKYSSDLKEIPKWCPLAEMEDKIEKGESK